MCRVIHWHQDDRVRYLQKFYPEQISKEYENRCNRIDHVLGNLNLLRDPEIIVFENFLTFRKALKLFIEDSDLELEFLDSLRIFLFYEVIINLKDSIPLSSSMEKEINQECVQELLTVLKGLRFVLRENRLHYSSIKEIK